MSDKPDIVLLVQEISDCMPDEWYCAARPKDGYWTHGHYILGPFDAKLFVRCLASKGKLEISTGLSVLPQPLDPPLPSSESICVSRSKSPKQIAADIARRLLPRYMSAVKAWGTNVQLARAARRQRDEANDRLAHLLELGGFKLRSRDSGHDATGFFAGPNGVGRVEIGVGLPVDGQLSARVIVEGLSEEQVDKFVRWAYLNLAPTHES